MNFEFIHKIAEERIQESEKRGELQNLEGGGKPIVYEDDSMIPEDLRMAYKILKNSGHLPPELQAERDIRNAMDLVEHLSDEREKYKQIQKVNFMIKQLNMKRRRPVMFEKQEVYYDKIVNKVRTSPSR